MDLRRYRAGDRLPAGARERVAGVTGVGDRIAAAARALLALTLTGQGEVLLRQGLPSLRVEFGQLGLLLYDDLHAGVAEEITAPFVADCATV